MGTKILIITNKIIARFGLKAILEQAPDLEVECTALICTEIVGNYKPDILFIDKDLQDLADDIWIQKVKSQFPDVHLIILQFSILWVTKPDTSIKLPLTKIQRNILELAVNGYTNVQTAHELHICRRGIEQHLTKIYEKLRVKNKAEAIAKFLREDL